MCRSAKFLLMLSLAVCLNATAATKAIKFGKLWDGHRVIANAVVIVEDDKIRSVAANGAIPAGVETIDLSRYTGIPGMIDMHTHVTYYWGGEPGTTPRRQAPRHVVGAVFRIGMPPEDELHAGSIKSGPSRRVAQLVRALP